MTKVTGVIHRPCPRIRRFTPSRETGGAFGGYMARVLSGSACLEGTLQTAVWPLLPYYQISLVFLASTSKLLDVVGLKT